MEPVTTITTGLTIAKGTTALFKEVKELFAKGTPEAALDTINQAEEKVSELLGNLIDVQGSVVKVQKENEMLKAELKSRDDWDSRVSKYNLVETEGKALVYEFSGSPDHYACPICIENKDGIYPLQDQRVYSGTFICMKCKATFPIKALVKRPTNRKVSSWKVR